MGRPDGKVAIVTGASRGIGAEIARVVAAEGGRVVCAARSLSARPSTSSGRAEDVAAHGSTRSP